MYFEKCESWLLSDDDLDINLVSEQYQKFKHRLENDNTLTPEQHSDVRKTVEVLNEYLESHSIHTTDDQVEAVAQSDEVSSLLDASSLCDPSIVAAEPLSEEVKAQKINDILLASPLLTKGVGSLKSQPKNKPS